MIAEIFDTRTDRLFYWPADGNGRPALLSNGHWIIRCDAGRGTAGLAPDAKKPCRWDGGVTTDGPPPCDAVWNDRALALDDHVRVEVTGCTWRSVKEDRACDLPPGTIRFGKRDGRYFGYGPGALILSDADGKVRVGIDPLYYSAALDLGLELWAVDDLGVVQLRRDGAVVGLVMPVRL